MPLGLIKNNTGQQRCISFDKKGERSHYAVAISSKENKQEDIRNFNMRSLRVKKEEIIFPLP